MMGTPTVTNLNHNDGILKRGKSIDILLTATGAHTFKKNTLLALDSVSLKAVPFAIGGVTNDNGIPRFLLPYEVVAAGAGDTKVSALQECEVATARVVVDADGDASNITNAEKVLCKQNGIVLVDVQNVTVLDNQ